jgi:PleD family two-component response regulator
MRNDVPRIRSNGRVELPKTRLILNDMIRCGILWNCREHGEEQTALPDNSFPFRILIVEDDSRLRQTGKLLLGSQGYEVHVAGDGFEALLALKRSLPDIIISDPSRPHMNGFELLLACGAAFQPFR